MSRGASFTNGATQDRGPLVYLVFNVNPKNLPPVVEVEDRPTDPFLTDPHITWAICCIGLLKILIVIVCATNKVRSSPRRGAS